MEKKLLRRNRVPQDNTAQMEHVPLRGLSVKGVVSAAELEEEKTPAAEIAVASKGEAVVDEADADVEQPVVESEPAYEEPVYEEPLYEEPVEEELVYEEPVYEEPEPEPVYTYETTYEEVVIPKEVQYIGNPQKDNDQMAMQQIGQDGKKIHTWLHTYEDGVLIDSHITKTAQVDPVPDIMEIGTNIVVIPEHSSYEQELAKMKEFFPGAFE